MFAPILIREGLVPVGEDGWYSIDCDPEVPIDNLGLQVTGSAVVYEIDFLWPDGTAIQSTTLGAIKRSVAGIPARN